MSNFPLQPLKHFLSDLLNQLEGKKNGVAFFWSIIFDPLSGLGSAFLYVIICLVFPMDPVLGTIVWQWNLSGRRWNHSAAVLLDMRMGTDYSSSCLMEVMCSVSASSLINSTKYFLMCFIQFSVLHTWIASLHKYHVFSIFKSFHRTELCFILWYRILCTEFLWLHVLGCFWNLNPNC